MQTASKKDDIMTSIESQQEFRKFFYEDEPDKGEWKSRKFAVTLAQLIGTRKLKSMEWELDRIQLFDFYRFFRRFGKIKHAEIMNKSWGPYFREAVITYNDFVVTINYSCFLSMFSCTIYHRHMREIRKFWNFVKEWIVENNVLRGKEFTFPSLGRPKISYASYINDSTKRLVEENTVLFFRKLRQLKNYGLRTRRGIILYGNPGNGKTSICRYISRKLPGVTRIWVTSWHMNPSDVSDAFRIARKFSPSIIFFEDLDTVGASRRLAGGINPILGKLLNEMDGITSNDGIVVVATTNDIHVLDTALANRPGRFDLKIHIGNPHPKIVKRITGHEDDITLAEAFRRRHDKIYYERILGRKYNPPVRKGSIYYIG